MNINQMKCSIKNIFCVLFLVFLNSCQNTNDSEKINKNKKVELINIKYGDGFIIDGGYYRTENSNVLIIPIEYKFVNTSNDIFYSGGSNLFFEFKNVNNTGMDLHPINNFLNLIMYNSNNERQIEFTQLKPFKQNDTISCIGYLNISIFSEKYSNSVIDEIKHLEFILKDIPFVLKTTISFSGNTGKENINEILLIDSTDKLKNIIKNNYFNKNIELKKQLSKNSLEKYFEKKYKIKNGKYDEELELLKKYPYLKSNDTDRY